MSKVESDIDKIFYSIDKPCEELHEVKTLSKFKSESDNDINSSIGNTCEEMLKEKSIPGVELDIDMKPCSIEKLCGGLKNEEEITRKIQKRRINFYVPYKHS